MHNKHTKAFNKGDKLTLLRRATIVRLAWIQNQNILRVIGIILISASLFILYGWLGATDPECEYTMEIFLQLRLCDEYIADQKELSILYPIGSLLALAIGLLCIKFSGDEEAENKDNEAA